MARGGIPTCVLCLLAQVVNVPFMRIRVIAALTFVLAGAVGTALPSSHASVASPSPGCALLNDASLGLDGTYKERAESVTASPFAPGEVISITATGASAGMTSISATIFRFDGVISHTMVHQTSNLPTPGRILMVVPEAFPYPPSSISWSLLPFDPHSTATWEVECIPYTAPPSSGGSADSDSVPTFELQLDSGVGGDCATSASGVVGVWVDLPNLNECTSEVGRAGRSFLGWATTPDFPVAIAQRQVDNGWGAYEIFDSTGALSGVFIPRGSATLISAPAEIYPIWSD